MERLYDLGMTGVGAAVGRVVDAEWTWFGAVSMRAAEGRPSTKIWPSFVAWWDADQGFLITETKVQAMADADDPEQIFKALGQPPSGALTIRRFNDRYLAIACAVYLGAQWRCVVAEWMSGIIAKTEGRVAELDAMRAAEAS